MEVAAWGWHKCNVDGTFFTSCTSGSTGIILRDHDGHFMARRATRYNLACDALMMEAFGLHGWNSNGAGTENH
jgi:hypothetical protein